jgi:hypothetical protein
VRAGDVFVFARRSLRLEIPRETGEGGFVAASPWVGMDIKTVSTWLRYSTSAVTHSEYSGWLDGDSDLRSG